MNNYKLKTFLDIFGQLHTQEYKGTTNQIVRLHSDGMKSKKSQTRLISWYLKRKPTWRKDLITYNSHPWIMVFQIDWLSLGERRDCLKLDVQGQGGGRILDVDGQRRWWWGLENCTIFMDVICLSPLMEVILCNGNILFEGSLVFCECFFFIKPHFSREIGWS